MQATAEGTHEVIEERRLGSGGEIVVKRYQKRKLLGKGGFAKCYEMKELSTGQLLAVKVIEKASLARGRARQKLQSEIAIHRAMHHSAIVKFEGYFEDSRHAYILLELCPNQTLKETVKRRRKLHELEAQFYLRQLVGGLEYIHAQNVIHRDLKLGNLFLARNLDLKIGDFGLAAKVEGNRKRRTVCGTPNYIAPEVLNSRISGHSYEADVWSVGVILYTMLVGKPPFETSTVKGTYRKIRANDYRIPEDAGLSTEAKTLIRKLLLARPEDRPTLDCIRTHEFLQKNQIPTVLPLSTLSMAPSETFLQGCMKGDKPEPSKPLLNVLSAVTLRQSSAELNLRTELNTPHHFLLSRGSGIVSSSRPTTTAGNLLPSNPPLSFPLPAPGPRLHRANNYFASTTDLASGLLPITTTSLRPQPIPPHQTTCGHNRILAKAHTQHPVLGLHCVDPPKPLLETSPSHQLYSALTASDTNLVAGTSKLAETPKSGSPGLGPEMDFDLGAVYIHYHQNCADRYGIGYILTNGAAGFYFNDLTNLLWLESKGQHVYNDYSMKGADTCRYITGPASSKDIDKKVRILSYFLGWYRKQLAEGRQRGPSEMQSTNELDTTVKRVMKTSSGLLFRLSNGVVQMAFNDQSQLVLYINGKLLLFIGKQGERQCAKLGNDLVSSVGENVIKRLQYTLQVLQDGAAFKRPQARPKPKTVKLKMRTQSSASSFADVVCLYRRLFSRV